MNKKKKIYFCYLVLFVLLLQLNNGIVNGAEFLPIPSKVNTPAPTPIPSIGKDINLAASNVNAQSDLQTLNPVIDVVQNGKNSLKWKAVYPDQNAWGNRLELYNSVIGWRNITPDYYTRNGEYKSNDLATGIYMGRLTYSSNGKWYVVDKYIELKSDLNSLSYSNSLNNLLINRLNKTGEGIGIEFDSNGNVITKRKVTPYEFSSLYVELSTPSFDVSITSVPSSIKKLEIPTWSETNGQDDLEWILAEKVDTHTWRGTIKFDKHGNNTGNYFIHVYADGKFIKGTSLSVFPSKANITAPAGTNNFEGTDYFVYANNVDQNVNEVKFPTWSAKNDQDDILWINGTKVNSTTWKAVVTIKNHVLKGTDRILTDVYAYDRFGTSKKIGDRTSTFIEICNVRCEY